MTGGRAALVAGAALAAALGMHFARGLPWKLAGIVGVAVGILALMGLRSVDQLRRIWRGPEERE